MNLERLVRQTFWRFGLDVKRASLPGTSLGLMLNLLKFSGADIVFDVGANEGQFARDLIAFRPRTKVVSFEPVSVAHALLIASARGKSNWVVAERVALGETSGTSTIYVTENSQCSSLRSITSDGPKLGSCFDLNKTESVPVERFDRLCRGFIRRESRLYLKVDVQGFEREVIAGSRGVMDQIVGMQVETSFHEIYSGQAIGFELVDYIVEAGFDLYGISNGWRDEKSGRLLQADAFFVRRPALRSYVGGAFYSGAADAAGRKSATSPQQLNHAPDCHIDGNTRAEAVEPQTQQRAAS